MSEAFDEAFWEERYRGHGTAHHGRPTPPLAAEVEDLAPGTALDAGCGEGVDAIWLARRGWRVTAVDIAPSALRHAREHARTGGAEATGRIDWVRADLTSWAPATESFDLVCSLYAHPAASRDALFDRLAASVAPGGTLLIVGHHLSTTSPAHGPGTRFTAKEIANGLDPDRWDILVAEARTRSTTDHDGHELTLHDAVLTARKRPPRG